MRFKLFVYGTLKRGYENHRYLKEANFLEKASTKEHYPMIAPKKSYPYLIDMPSIGKIVRGELYLVDIATLKQIDRLEEAPWLYRRKLIEVVDEQGGVHRAYTYFFHQKVWLNSRLFLEKF